MMLEDVLPDMLAAGARMRNQGRTDGRDPYPSDGQIATFRRQVVAMLQDLDGAITVSELREEMEGLD